MKNIILTVILLISVASTCLAQEKDKRLEMYQGIPHGTYFQHDYLDDYVGTWAYSSGHESFLVTLKRGKTKYITGANNHFFEESLYGWITYKKGNDIVLHAQPSQDESNLIGGAKQGDDIVLFFFYDAEFDKHGRIEVEFIGKNKNRLRWKLPEPIEQWAINKPLPPKGYSIPTDMVLKRVKE